jgi:hypothetical protein
MRLCVPEPVRVKVLSAEGAGLQLGISGAKCELWALRVPMDGMKFAGKIQEGDESGEGMH